MPAVEPFPDRLARAVTERRSQVVLGLDPDPAALWPSALAADPPDSDGEGDVAERTAAAVVRHCRAVVEAAGPACVAVKLQLACFERLGGAGWSALHEVLATVRSAGLMTIADGKRGDVPVTASAYADALVGETVGPYGAIPGLGADAFTANPLLGRDALAPLVEAAVGSGAGCFVLVRTSNPGAAELQDAPEAEPLSERLAALVADLGAAAVGASGLASVGAVVGATRPDLLGRLRSLMPRAILLLPGVGAQGGAVEPLRAAFEPGPAAALVAASRSIVRADEERGGDPPQAATAAAEELRAAVWTVSARR